MSKDESNILLFLILQLEENAQIPNHNLVNFLILHFKEAGFLLIAFSIETFMNENLFQIAVTINNITEKSSS